VLVTDDPGPRVTAGRANITDVAARAGVSPATVSRSLRGLTNVSPDTRDRVLEAARDLSYYSPATVGDLAPVGRSVAVIVPFINRWFFSTVTAGAATLLREHGYDVLLYHLGSANARDDFFQRMPLARRVAGILTLSMPLSEEHTLALRALDIPLVSVGSTMAGSPSVGIDDVAAARGAVNHLIHLRHDRIGLLAGEPDDPRFAFVSSSERRVGAEQALEAAGLALDPDLVAAAPHGIEGGAAAMARLLAGRVLPTAVFAEYDELAIGALWTLRRAGLRVPDDISVIGIDDHEMAAVLDLTTVAQSASEQGTTAARLLMQVLESGAEGPTAQPVLLPSRLLLRGSTAPRVPQAERAASALPEGAPGALPSPRP
jgi:LacI family repressor for deo operon, udp, cdd, tsx, nupC, and nupG